MKLSKEFIRGLIKEAFSENGVDDPTLDMGSEEAAPPADEIKAQTIDALGRIVAGLEGMFDQAQEMGEMFRGIRPDLAGEETNITTPVQELMEKIDEVIKELESDETD